ncbi:MAG: hypothetical protein COB02_16815 [Candidatus Cloacimonadota bacterium]|nr:MAG: hypothetical protein COB02_16815 [Candidatus Cloacimonadota bacterium]
MKKFALFAAITGLSLSLIGCGSDDDVVAVAVATATVNGSVASGAPWANTNITLKSLGGTSKSVSGLTDASGNYSFDVSALTGPFLLKASKIVRGKRVNQFSYTASAGVANVNPIASLILKTATNTDPSVLFDSPSTGNRIADLKAKIAQARDLTNKIFKNLYASYNVPSTFNPLTSTFLTNNKGFDGLLDAVKVEFNGNNAVKIRSRFQNNIELASIPSVSTTNLASLTSIFVSEVAARATTTIVSEIPEIREMITDITKKLVSKKAGVNVTNGDLSKYFEDGIYSGFTKDTLITRLLKNEVSVDSLASLSIETINGTTRTLDFQLGKKDGATLDGGIFGFPGKQNLVKKINNQWKFLPNGQKTFITASTTYHRIQSSSSKFIGTTAIGMKFSGKNYTSDILTGFDIKQTALLGTVLSGTPQRGLTTDVEDLSTITSSFNSGITSDFLDFEFFSTFQDGTTENKTIALAIPRLGNLPSDSYYPSITPSSKTTKAIKASGLNFFYKTPKATPLRALKAQIYINHTSGAVKHVTTATINLRLNANAANIAYSTIPTTNVVQSASLDLTAYTFRGDESFKTTFIFEQVIPTVDVPTSNANNLPSQIKGQVVTMVFSNAVTSAPYTNGETLLFTFSSSNSLFIGNNFTKIASLFTKPNTEYIWTASDGTTYALSLKTDGSINKVNIGSTATAFLGQFKPQVVAVTPANPTTTTTSVPTTTISSSDQAKLSLLQGKKFEFYQQFGNTHSRAMLLFKNNGEYQVSSTRLLAGNYNAGTYTIKDGKLQVFALNSYNVSLTSTANNGVITAIGHLNTPASLSPRIGEVLIGQYDLITDIDSTGFTLAGTSDSTGIAVNSTFRWTPTTTCGGATDLTSIRFYTGNLSPSTDKSTDCMPIATHAFAYSTPKFTTSMLADKKFKYGAPDVRSKVFDGQIVFKTDGTFIRSENDPFNTGENGNIYLGKWEIVHGALYLITQQTSIVTYNPTVSSTTKQISITPTTLTFRGFSMLLTSDSTGTLNMSHVQGQSRITANYFDPIFSPTTECGSSITQIKVVNTQNCIDISNLPTSSVITLQ